MNLTHHQKSRNMNSTNIKYKLALVNLAQAIKKVNKQSISSVHLLYCDEKRYIHKATAFQMNACSH